MKKTRISKFFKNKTWPGPEGGGARPYVYWLTIGATDELDV